MGLILLFVLSLFLSTVTPHGELNPKSSCSSKSSGGGKYAQVLRMLGNGRCECLCINGTKRLCHIRDKMHKKVWIAADNIVLVGLRDYQDNKADVILKYMPDEARVLKAYDELPKNTRLNDGVAGGMGEDDEGVADDFVEFGKDEINKI